MKPCLALALLCATMANAAAHKQKSNTGENLRGISAVSSAVVWASGTHGTYLRTTDGGTTWEVSHVPGAETLDFRDVEAFSANEAYLLAAGPGEQSRIYKTTNAGKDWTLQFTNKDPKGFFDCMAFWDRDHGIAVGDPVDGKFELIKTENGGKQWKPIPPAKLPPAIEGEGAFAASGTCIAVQGKRDIWFATGGKVARVFRSYDAGKNWEVAQTPIVSGEPSAGIFSLAFRNEREGVIAGGDYKKPGAASANLAFTSDGGATWKIEPLSDHNSFYFSAVAFTGDGEIVLVGTAGVLQSLQRRTFWQGDRSSGFNALAVNGRSTFAVGPGGEIATLDNDLQERTGDVTVLTDTHGLDFSKFLSDTMRRVRANWYRNVPEVARRPLRKEGTAIVDFAVLRDGSIEDVHLVQSTNDKKMDEAAVAGITESAPMQPLPAAFDQKKLSLRIRFLYNLEKNDPDHR
jgi:TonB family protein